MWKFEFHQPGYKKIILADLNSFRQTGYQILVKNGFLMIHSTKWTDFDHLGVGDDPNIRISIFLIRWGLWGCKGSKVWKITTDYCRVIQVPEFSFILMFWKQIFFVRIMKYQVEFWHLLSWRLLRPAYVNFLKTGGWNSNVQISWSHWAP